MDTMRTFSSGATRHSDENKLDFEGFLSPIVLERYAQYLHKHRKQADGEMRDSDNWQQGIPKDVYMKSALRHFIEVWKAHRGFEHEDLQESLCAVMFNVMGYLFEELKPVSIKDYLREKLHKNLHDDAIIGYDVGNMYYKGKSTGALFIKEEGGLRCIDSNNSVWNVDEEDRYPMWENYAPCDKEGNEL